MKEIVERSSHLASSSTRERLQALVAGLKAVPEQLRVLVDEYDRRSEELAHRFESTPGRDLPGVRH